MNQFKVGDIVCGCKLNIEATFESGFWNEELALVGSSSNKSELEQLVEDANKGEIAVQKIMRNYSGEVIGYFENSNTKVDKDWRAVYSYKVKENPKFKPFHVNSGAWRVDVEGTEILIGCMAFKTVDLVEALKGAQTGHCTLVTTGGGPLNISPTRTGVRCHKGTLPWSDVDLILDSLKDIN